MPTLSTLRNQTVPARVDIGGGNSVTFDVRVTRGTPADKRQFADLLKDAGQLVQEKGERAVALQREKDELLAPVQSLIKERRALAESDAEDNAEKVSDLEKQIDAARDQLKGELDALNAKLDECEMEGETALHEALARQLAFYVASTDITTETGEAIAPVFEFFRDEFSFKLLEKSLEAVSEAISGPLATPDSTEN